MNDDDQHVDVECSMALGNKIMVKTDGVWLSHARRLGGIVSMVSLSGMFDSSTAIPKIASQRTWHGALLIHQFRYAH